MDAWGWGCATCGVAFLTFGDTEDEPCVCPYCRDAGIYLTYHYLLRPTEEEL